MTLRILKKLSFLLFPIISLNVFAAWQNTGSAEPKVVDVKVISSTQNETILEYRVSGFDLSDVIIDGKTFSKISIPEATNLSQIGHPSLPRVSKNIHVPAGSTAQIEVEKVVTQDFAVNPVVPSKGPLTRNIDPKTVAFTFSPDIYAAKKNVAYPEKNFQSTKEFMIRNARGVNVGFFPIQFFPSKGIVRVTTQATLKIKTESKNRTAVKIDSVDEGWANILKGSFINGDKIKELNPFQKFSPSALDRSITHFMQDTGRVLVITPTQFKASLAPWFGWKTQKGMRLSVKEIDTTDYKVIKSLIQEAYDNDKISYVLLIGDAEFMPFHKGVSDNANGNEADPMYGLVEGDDTYPDLVVSRFSVKNTAELDVMVAKSISYEKNPDTAGDWYAKGVGIASNEGDPTDWERLEWVREILEGYNYTKIDKQYAPDASKKTLTEQINEGRGFINYTGHGSQSMWVTTGFNSSDVNALKNTGKLPFIVSVACVNGAFGGGGDVFAERWLKVGTTTDARGAIAIFASSTNQAWVEPTVGQLEISRLLAAEQFNTVGSLFFHGSIAILEDNAEWAKQTFETWHIFGDGTTQVRTKVPTAIDDTTLADAIVTNSEVVLHLNEKGIQAGVVQGETLLGSGISDESGTLKIKIDTEIMTHKPATLTLTGYNKIPKITEISFPEK